MNINGREILNNLDMIDKILNSEDAINSYMLNIESSNDYINAPNDMKDRILLNCRIIDNKNVTKKKSKIRYFDILKVVACALFAIIIWEGSVFGNLIPKNFTATEMAQNDTNNYIKPNDIQVKHESIFDKVNDTFKDFSRSLVRPIDNIKNEEEKK